MLGEFIFSERAEGFDNHISNSIRHYDTLWENVLKISEYFVENNTNVYDLGCSTGKLLKAMFSNNHKRVPNVQYIGIDGEENFTADYDTNNPKLKLTHGDVRTYNYEDATFCTSIFTLQFIALKDRQEVVNRIYDALNPGGAFVIAEKIISEDAKIQCIMDSLHNQFRHEHLDGNDIISKERDLRTMMKPISDSENIEMLETAGFTNYQKFWQNYNFNAYICIK